ncbi:hypothetical protein C8R46DRAFT_1228283 [Mycena filopes]|nr:hypothetical protein C8R46DRAFT_1228283 [Mycena filopes]
MNTQPTAPVHTTPPEDPIHTLLHCPSRMEIDLALSTLPPRDDFYPTLQIDNAAFTADWPVVRLQIELAQSHQSGRLVASWEVRPGPDSRSPCPSAWDILDAIHSNLQLPVKYPPGDMNSVPASGRWIDLLAGSTIFNGLRVRNHRLEVQLRGNSRQPEPNIRVSLACLPLMDEFLLPPRTERIDFALTFDDLMRTMRYIVHPTRRAFRPQMKSFMLRILNPSNPEGIALAKRVLTSPDPHTIHAVVAQVWSILHDQQPGSIVTYLDGLGGRTILESIRPAAVSLEGIHVFDVQLRDPEESSRLSPLVLGDSELPT